MYVLNVVNYILLFTLVYCSQLKKVIRFDLYEVCELPPNSPMNLSYIYIKRYGYGSAIDAKFEITREVLVLKVSTKITRCHNKEQLDSCEYFTTITLKNACGYAAAKNSILTPMVYAHKPPFTCPLRKGMYICTNGTFNPDVVNIFPLENFYWKVEEFVYDASSDELIYKFCLEGQVIAYRK